MTRNHLNYHVFFPSLQICSPINNQGLLRSLQVIICVLWQPQAAANWQASMREMLCKFYEWQRRLVEWLCTCNFDLLGAVHAGRWKGGRSGDAQGFRALRKKKYHLRWIWWELLLIWWKIKCIFWARYHKKYFWYVRFLLNPANL